VFNGCLLTVTLVVHLLTAMLVQEGVRVFLFLCTLSCGGVGMYLVLAWMTGDDLGRKDGEVTSLTAREAFRTTVEVTMNEAGLLALVPCHVAAGAIEAMVLGRGMEGFNVGLATGVKTVAGGLVSGLVAVGVGGKEGRRGKVIWIGFGVHFACAVLYGIGGSACGWTMFALGGAGQAIWANVSSGSAIASRVGALADGEKIRECKRSEERTKRAESVVGAATSGHASERQKGTRATQVLEEPRQAGEWANGKHEVSTPFVYTASSFFHTCVGAFAFTKFCSGMSTSAGFFLMPVVVERGGLGVIVALIVAACAGGYGGLKRREVKYELLSNG